MIYFWTSKCAYHFQSGHCDSFISPITVTKNSNHWLEKFSWAKHLVILGKCKDPLEREFSLSDFI